MNPLPKSPRILRSHRHQPPPNEEVNRPLWQRPLRGELSRDAKDD